MTHRSSSPLAPLRLRLRKTTRVPVRRVPRSEHVMSPYVLDLRAAVSAVLPAPVTTSTSQTVAHAGRRLHLRAVRPCHTERLYAAQF